jgi:hypothetical protein
MPRVALSIAVIVALAFTVWAMPTLPGSLADTTLLVWASAAWLSANVEAMAAIKIEMRIV